MAFASVADLELRFRKLAADEKDRASALLEDAEVILQAELKRAGKEVDPEDESQAAALKSVCCHMAKRALANSGQADISQVSHTVGPFASSVSYANPSADIYLTDQERRTLGIPKHRQRIGFIGPWHNGEDGACVAKQ